MRGVYLWEIFKIAKMRGELEKRKGKRPKSVSILHLVKTHPSKVFLGMVPAKIINIKNAFPKYQPSAASGGFDCNGRNHLHRKRVTHRKNREHQHRLAGKTNYSAGRKPDPRNSHPGQHPGNRSNHQRISPTKPPTHNHHWRLGTNF